MLLSSLRALFTSRDARWVLGRLAASPHRISKLHNLARAQWAKLRRDPTGGNAMPLVVSVEPTNACNMRCPMCPTGLGVLKRPKGVMDFDRFTKLVDELARTTLIMTFWGWGESTLHPRLYEMIKLARSRGIFTMLTMNGTKIEPDALIDCGLDLLVVSFDGTRAESYDPVRVGGSLDYAMAGIRRLAQAKQARGAKRPRVDMGFIVTKLNERELPSLESFAKELGFDAARPKYFHAITRQAAAMLQPEDRRLRGEVGMNGPGRRLESDIPGFDPSKVDVRNECGLLWQHAVIFWDGSMVPCCYDWDAENKLDDAFGQGGVRRAWNGGEYQRFRKQILADKKQLTLCKECPGGDVTVFFTDSFLLPQ